MAVTTLTSKGQMTIPKEIREQFHLRDGDRLEVQVEGDKIVLIPPSGSIEDLASILPSPKKRASLAEMQQAVRKRPSSRSR